MIPKSTAWQVLRGEALRFIPSPTKLYFTQALPLRDWRLKGSYVVTSSDKKRIVLRASSSEMANVIFADVEFLLDQAAEQRAALKIAATTLPWDSPAWTTVTAYYWSFFSALALTRIIGRSTWFLDKSALLDLRALANVATGRPGAGTLLFEVLPQQNSDCELHLTESGRNNHEAVWHCFNKLVGRVFAAANQNSSIDEYRLWWCLSECAKILGESWPSEIRNDVNYKAGYAYREVMRLPKIKASSEIRKLSKMDLSALLASFEAEIYRMQGHSTFQDDLQTRSKLLIINALVLALISEAIHEDVLSRIDGDPRWLRVRKRFLSERCATDTTQFWPFGSQS